MNYEFISNDIERDNIKLPESDKIDSCLLKNNYTEIVKAIDFFTSDEKFLYVHGFIGTGKRQFVKYICEFFNSDVIKLEYYCREATVCDDILLNFTNIIDDNSISKAVSINAKITTLNVKFNQQISSIKKPFVIILHSLDNVLEENLSAITKTFSEVVREENVKIIITTKALKQNLIEDRDSDRKIFLKAFTKEIFKEYLVNQKIEATDKQIEDFYKISRGYYFYTAISSKIMQAMNIPLAEYIQKFEKADMNFDSFIGLTYINLIPNAVKNFFWFLRSIRHGISLNALAVLDLYDEFSIEYLKSNYIIFQAGDMIYLQDYFAQKVEIILPKSTGIKLHKFVIGIYEGQIKEPLKTRVIMLSRQALRTEIEYHKKCISDIENGADEETSNIEISTEKSSPAPVQIVRKIDATIAERMKHAAELSANKKYTEAIEAYIEVSEDDKIDLSTLVECRLNLARLYKSINEFKSAKHYYELVETFYKNNNEQINLNYLYYELTDLYYKMYKNERAIETIKKVIYSVDTPQSLMVNACTLLGNIYSDLNNTDEAFSYYKKALDSLDENVDKNILAELYFKFALANDDKEEYNTAFEYYNKCTNLDMPANPYAALSYSNLASCYYDRKNYDDAIFCFNKAYKIEHDNNNYDGIYYIASNLAKIYAELNSKEALKYLIEAQKSAEFINEPEYIIESSIALGDYYYNIPNKKKEALNEYLKVNNIASMTVNNVNFSKLKQRIEDMRLRMSKEDFENIEKKYEK